MLPNRRQIETLAKAVHESNFDHFSEIKLQLEDFEDFQQGLDLNGVEESRGEFGANVLPQTPAKKFFAFVVDAAQDRILILLSIAAIFSLGIHWKSGGWIEGVAILTAVLIVIMVNAINDWKKDQLFRALNRQSQSNIKAKVIRNGVQQQVLLHELVIGDIILLEPGNIIPADAVLIHQNHQLIIDESSITGESESVKKDRNENPFLLSGTKILDGNGSGLVVAVGVDSFHGKMMMAMRGEVESTPLQIKLNALAESIAKYGLTLASLLLVALIVKNARSPSFWEQLPEFCISAITVVVVAVPEGLPMAVTLALAFATNQMLKDNNLVRVLASCETMGRVTSICSDKTGTLTENKMTVVRTTFPEELPDDLKKLISNSIAINSTAFESVNETFQLVFVGSSTEAAMLRFAKQKFDAAYSLLRQQNPVKHMIPFSSVRKLMITCVEDGNAYLKGAAEIVLGMCNYFLTRKGEIAALDGESLRNVRRQLGEMSGVALRNIGLAFKRDVVNYSDEALLESGDFVWIGAVGIEDPLRANVPEAVKTCQRAGIFVRMVTGDNRATAESIAKRCGILMRGGLSMEGPEFRSLSDEQLVKQLPKLQVLARSSPLDKQRLVHLLKKQLGEIVAVTGDGSNDGPALKAAHVGFSMGITGTQLAQEASSIVLLDDNFASIVRAVSWGRCITRSIRKFLQFQLTVNVTAVALAVVTSLTTASSVLTAVQMLWVNLIMDSLGALALATDSPTSDLLTKSPEHPEAPLITVAMYWNIFTQAAWQLLVCLAIFYLFPFAIDTKTLRCFTFNVFVFLQLFNELNCRALIESEFTHTNFISQIFDTQNWRFWTIWWSTVACQLLIIQFGGEVFSTTPLSLKPWLASVGIGVVGVIISLILNILRPWKVLLNLTVQPSVTLHPTRERLAWQSAIQNVQARLRFYRAVRRKVDS